ncbi:hypothetical protein [Natronospora cellulosivora (SeqCode)]
MKGLIIKYSNYILIVILIISCFFLVETMQNPGQAVSGDMSSYLNLEHDSREEERNDEFSIEEIVFSAEVLTEIASRELFALRKEEVLPEIEVEPEPKPNEDEIAREELLKEVEKEKEVEVDIPLRLIGISAKPGDGRAILENTSNREINIVRQHDYIEGFKIILIWSDYLIIEKDQQLFLLEFEK